MHPGSIESVVTGLQSLTLAVMGDSLPSKSLLFSPFNIIFLIVWFYLCIASVQWLDGNRAVPANFRGPINLVSLFIGPFVVTAFVVGHYAFRIQRGELDIREELLEFISNPFKYRKGIFAAPEKSDDIELVDSSGRRFVDVYGGQGRNKKEAREVLNMTEGIMLNSIRQRASDVLIDPQSQESYSVRYRIDGFLRTVQEIDAAQCNAVVNSIKAISSMDIAEKRRPQDGSFMARIPEGSVYFRVASAGVMGGEKLSIRVLNQAEGILPLEEIGLSSAEYQKICDSIEQPSGMILVCGPTGSGKSTTLYAMLSKIDRLSRNIVTVEDPIEYVLPNVSQIEVNPKANITFANALRSILRQDPDVICVGEIRDGETAGMALQAAQTGHLVMATLHSTSNMASMVRLIDLGAKPLLIASAVSIIVSIRLVRKLCDNCKHPANLSSTQIGQFKKKNVDYSQIMVGRGCEECGHTGYKGRTGLFDIMVLDENIKNKLASNQLSVGDLKQQGDEHVRSTLRKQGMRKVLKGLTTIEEVKRVTSNLG